MPFPPSSPIEVLLVVDDPVTRTEFAGAVRHDATLHLLEALGSTREALEFLALRAPGILVVDPGLPDGEAIDLVRFTTQRHPGCAITLISMFGDEDEVLAGIAAGATGFVPKDSTREDIAAHLRMLREGCSPISPLIALALLSRFGPEPGEAGRRLSERHRRTLRDLALGYVCREAAAHAGTTETEVGRSINEIYRLARGGEV